MRVSTVHTGHRTKVIRLLCSYYLKVRLCPIPGQSVSKCFKVSQDFKYFYKSVFILALRRFYHLYSVEHVSAIFMQFTTLWYLGSHDVYQL